MPAFDVDRRLSSWRFGTMVVLLVACFLLGGASRLDVLSLVLLQPLSVICAGLFLATSPALRWHSIKAPLLFLAALASIMAVQLIPLPPELWMALPGHAPLARTAEVAGLPQPWRPISVTPDLTLASLVSLSVPFAILLGFGALSTDQTRRLLPFLIAGAALSAVIGLAQVAGGGRGPLYFYEITNSGSPVGVFANRNHQAILMAIAWPMLALWAGRAGGADPSGARPLIALAVGFFFVPLMLVIGSRGGLVFGFLGMVAVVFFWRSGGAKLPAFAGSRVVIGAGLVVGVAVVIGAVLALSRDEALQRLIGTELGDEARLEFYPTIVRMVLDFAPVGAGFGSFDPLFRTYEPFDLLTTRYLNHAHNDLLELAVVGGLPALAVAVAFLLWFGARVVGAMREKGAGTSRAFALLGAVLVLILSLSSLVDYPLRTPLLAALFAIASGWISDYSPKTKRSDRADRAPSETGAESTLLPGAQ